MSEGKDLKTLEYEITLDCNYKCPYCTNGRNDLLKNKIRESFDIEKLKKTFSLYDFIYVYGGEPLLSPKIMDVLGILQNKNHVIQTNFSKPKIIEKIIKKYPNTKFWVSAHNTQIKDKETFKQLLSEYKNNIDELNVMFYNYKDINFYLFLKDVCKNVQLTPVAGFGAKTESQEKRLNNSLIKYNRLRSLKIKWINFDTTNFGKRSFNWEKQIKSPMKGKPCPCAERYFQLDPSLNLHHCPLRYDGTICPFNMCFNYD